MQLHPPPYTTHHRLEVCHRRLFRVCDAGGGDASVATLSSVLLATINPTRHHTSQLFTSNIRFIQSHTMTLNRPVDRHSSLFFHANTVKSSHLVVPQDLMDGCYIRYSKDGTISRGRQLKCFNHLITSQL